MEREKRTSRESMSSDETVDIDFELNNLSIIPPEEVINMIISSTILSHNIKILVQYFLVKKKILHYFCKKKNCRKIY